MKKEFVILLVSAFLISCDNVLPFPTKSGRNIFGWKADGIKLKTPKVHLLKDNPIIAQMTDSSVFIYGKDYDARISVYMSISHIIGKGTYQLDSTNEAYYVDNNYPGKTYKTTEKYRGSVTITKFDTKNRIVSGTFSFKAVKLDNSVYPNKLDTTNVIEVTRGRFDVDLNKLKK
jgi:hypothetical protein